MKPSRKPPERTTVAVLLCAEVQDNGDGTWTAVARFGHYSTRAETRETREDALNAAAQIFCESLSRCQ